MRRAKKEDNKRRKEKTKNEKVKLHFEDIKENIKSIKLDKKKLTILVVCFIVIIGIIVANNYISLGLVLNKNITSEDVIQVELANSNNKIIAYGNEILVYNKGKINIYNNYGKSTGEIILEDTANALISTADSYIQVINKDKKTVYVYKNEYEVARIKVDGDIYGGSINSDGTSIIEYSANGSKTALGVYDSSGKMEYSVKLSNNIIGKYALSNNSRYLAYVDVNIKGISVKTNVNLIDLNNIKEDETNTKTVHTIDNAIVYDVYWDGKNVVIREEDAYAIYNVMSDKKQEAKISEHQLSRVAEYNQKCAYIELNQNGEYILNIRKILKDKTKSAVLSDAPKYFEYENGIAYVCYSKKVEAYNNSGVKIKTFDSDMVITEPIIFNEGRSFAMTISNKLILFTI